MSRLPRSGTFPVLLAGSILLASCGDLLTRGEDPRLEEVEYASLSVGGDFSCGLSRGGEAFCWGGNRTAQLGGGLAVPLVEFFYPIPVTGGHRFHSIAAGTAHVCALDGTGVAFCWGHGGGGELGIEPDRAPNTCRSSPCAAEPVRLPTELRFRALDAGGGHTCGITRDGDAYCWGRNEVGQLGIEQVGGFVPSPTRVRTGEGVRFVQVSVGESHTCGLSQYGRAYCWGGNDWGQLGADAEARCGALPPGACSPTALRSAEGLTFTKLSAGGQHTCGVAEGAAAYCWGANHQGALGVPPPSIVGLCGPRTEPARCSVEPVAVSGDLAFTFVSAGGGHTCGLTERGGAHCWGSNPTGTVGDCTIRGYVPEPSPVCGGHRFLHLDGGPMHRCGVAADGAAYCWGLNDGGALGSSTFTAFGPVPVVRPRRVGSAGS